MNRVYLIGFMGVGKSTVAKKLASLLDWSYYDTDVAFEEKYKISINTFFEKYSEELFRKLENEILISTFDLDNCIISTGGGTPCYADAMNKINENGISVYLEMNEKAILNRLLKSKQKRPLVIYKSEDELFGFINEKLISRRPHYSKATMTFPALSLDINELFEKIKSCL